jgi:leader peptidase (prepilin peptidase)/N-methyltransferase
VRGAVWALLGLALGLRAVPRARRRIAALRVSGTVFGHGNVAASPIAVPFLATACAATAWRFADLHEGDLAMAARAVLVSAAAILTLVDIDTHVIPRGSVTWAAVLSFPLLGMAAVVDEGSVAGVAAGALVMWALLWVLAVVSRGDLGGGDVSLGFLLGGHLGLLDLWDVPRALFAAFMLGGVWAIGLLVTGRGRRTRFAFGPFLIVGALVVLLR